jgi:GT2 family glycosyltransferase
MPRVAVVIPNWNGRRLLGACLSALCRQTFPDFEIILVDNGSTDGSVASVREYFSTVRVIGNEVNRGFAAGVNQGIRASDSPFVATLNNDTEVSPGWLAALVAAAEGDPRVGMWASKMLFADRPTVINSTGICLDRAGIAWDRRGGALDEGSEREPVEIFGPCGGAALYRRAMLDEIGLFDEDFFAYLEDVDLAWRARLAGWRCLYVPAARVLHCHSATAREGSPFKSYLLGRNKVRLILKNYPFARLWPCVPLVLAYDALAVAYTIVTRGDVHALRGRLAGLAGMRKMWQKRERRNLDRARDLQYLSPIEPPWRIARRYHHLAPAEDSLTMY